MINNHIQEIQYHDYLDNDLNKDAQLVFEQHVAECQACRQELAELRQLFTAIESVPEFNLRIDLSSSILDAIDKQAGLSRNWKLATAIQFGLASILIIISWPLLSTYYSLYEFPMINTDYGTALTGLSIQINGYIIVLSGSINNLIESMSISSSQILLGDIGVFVWPTAVAATLLWLIGNGVLLRNNPAEIK